MDDMTIVLLADVELAVGALELVVLMVLRRHALMLTLLAGLGLMLSLRLAVGGLALQWVALALLASGLVHALDVQRRWSSKYPRRTLSPPSTTPHEPGPSP